MTRSLRGLLLWRLLPTMLALVTMGALLASYIAHRAATLAYDRALLDAAIAVASQVQIHDNKIYLELSPQAQEILLTDKFDTLYYEVVNEQGATIAGHPGLPRPHSWQHESNREYYDGQYHEKPVRIAAYRSMRYGKSILVFVAETTVKREALVHEILLGMVLPEIAIVFAALLLGWLLIRRGLEPLDNLVAELARRSHRHLGPVSVDPLPEELRPVASEINHLLNLLDHAMSAQRNFIFDAAHQLRTPVAALLAQAEAAEHEVAISDREAAKVDISRIISATRRLSHLAHQLLALARAEPGAKALMEQVQLAALIQAEAEKWLPNASAKQIEMEFDVSPANTTGSPLLLQEMLSNLLDNAIRYTPCGGRIIVRCRTLNGHIRLEVEDSGPGIPEPEREKIFERFHRLPGNDEDGCGLGLAIAKEICAQHGATISVSPGQVLGGSCFIIEFPPERA